MREMATSPKEWSFRKVGATGCGAGLSAFCAMSLADLALDATVGTVSPARYYDLTFLVLLFLLMAPPLGIGTVFYRRMWRCRTALLFGVWFAAGWLLPMVADVLLISRGFWIQKDTSLADWLWHFAWYAVPLMAVGSVISVLTWSGNRLIRGKPVLLDSPVCSHCEYSLRGISSGVCPECGSPYEIGDTHRTPEPPA
jgi:hypothetical protein